MITTDPKLLSFAFFGGILPALFWLWFWLKEDEGRPEPKGLLAIVFIMGMIAVIAVLPVEKFIQMHVAEDAPRLALWAAAEEIMKYLAVFIIVWRTRDIDEPIDWPTYLITAALGFAALENILFLIRPFTGEETLVGLLTGQLRFLGSTLLHAVASGMLGIALGIALYMRGFRKTWHICIGFILAIALHTAFNFFIMKNGGSDFLKVFAFLWVVTIVVMLLFEKVRRMSEDIAQQDLITN